MNFKIIDNNTFIIMVNNSYKEINNDNQNKVIKDLLQIIKKRYSFNVLGYYEVSIYKVDNLLCLLVFSKIDSDGYYNSVDLKIINHKEKIKIELDEFDQNNSNIYRICEHYDIKNINLLY